MSKSSMQVKSQSGPSVLSVLGGLMITSMIGVAFSSFVYQMGENAVSKIIFVFSLLIFSLAIGGIVLGTYVVKEVDT